MPGRSAVDGILMDVWIVLLMLAGEVMVAEQAPVPPPAPKPQVQSDRRKPEPEPPRASPDPPDPPPPPPPPSPEDRLTMWLQLAQCESSGRWSIATGNGYFGGLQIKQSTWVAYGGRQFAARADRASRAEQIAVAERILDGQGPNAWPSCRWEADLH